MSAVNDFDIGSLIWVKAEVDNALKLAADSLNVYAQQNQGQDLSACLGYLHQVSGALQMVGLEGASRFCVEIERVLEQEVKSSVSAGPNPRVKASSDAIEGLQSYLLSIVNGAVNAPLRLYNLYAALRHSLALPAHPSDLFFPNLNIASPIKASPVALKKQNVPDYLKQQRSRFQYGLLVLLRDEDQHGLDTMFHVLRNVVRLQTTTLPKLFWWSATGFVESLKTVYQTEDTDAKQLLTRIDLQLKRASEGSVKITEKLFRDILYFIGSHSARSENINAIVQTFDLMPLLPNIDLGEEAKSKQLESQIKHARTVVSAMQDAWIKYTAGNIEKLAAVQEELARFAVAIQPLKHPQLGELSTHLQSTLGFLVASQELVPEAGALEIATSLLIIDNALASYPPEAREFGTQVKAMVARLQAVKTGDLDNLSQLPNLPLLDQASQAIQEKMLQAQVSQEIRANLQVIEKALDTYFRDTSDVQVIEPLPGLIKQIQGALLMLDRASALEVMQFVESSVKQLQKERTLPNSQALEFLAESLNSVGFYVDDVEIGKLDAEKHLTAILPRIRGEQTQRQNFAQQEVSVEHEITQQKQKAQSLVSNLHINPSDLASKEALKETLTFLQQNADLVADAQLGVQSASALQLLNEEENKTPELANAISALAGDKPVVARPEQDDKALSEEAVDAELLEIYLEEAQEVIGNIQNSIDECAMSPRNKDAITTIRRGFHTLKGSGRMVGLMHLGDIGWAVEQLMNKWLQEERPATPELLDTLAYACECFTGWVEQLQSTGQASLEPSELLARVEMLKNDSEAVLVVDSAQQAATPAVVASAPSQAVPVATDGDIQIGQVVLSPTLFAIFTEESAQILARLQGHAHTLKEHPTQRLNADFLVASHTLSGIAHTTGFTTLAQMSQTLEAWVGQQTREPSAVASDEVDAVQAVIDVLTSQVQAIAHKQDLQVDAETPTRQLQKYIIEADTQTEQMLAQERMSQNEPFDSAQLSQMLDAVEESDNELSFDALLAEVTLSPAVPAVSVPSNEDLNFDDLIAAVASTPAQVAVPSAPSLDFSDVLAEVTRATPVAAEPVTPEAGGVADDIDEQLLSVFVEEAQELIPSISTQLRLWRDNPQESFEARNEIKRLLHTLKGSARMAGAMRLGDATHQMESRVLFALESGKVSNTTLDDIDNHFDIVNDLFEQLTREEAPVPQALELASAPIALAAAEAEQGRASIRVRAEVIDRLVNQAGEISISRSRMESEMLSLKRSLTDLTDNISRLRAQLREIEIQAETQMQSRQILAAKDSQFDPLEFDRFSRLQELTRFVAESINDVSTIQHNLSGNFDETNAALMQQSRMTKDLQQDLMRIRMIPFSSVSERLYRIVRQTAKELGKKVNLELKGANVEIDRSVLEKMTSPFEHMLRNSIDHAIESKEVRIASQKSEVGEILLEVRQEGNELVLTLQDDGTGLDVVAIRAKAIEKGIIKASDKLTDQQAMNLIFAPGFSTARTVTQVSGRGIGMDVVRTEVTNLGGRIEVSSTLGKGTVFTVHLPLTLAVTQVVLVDVAGKVFAIPSVMVEQVQELKFEALSEVYAQKSMQWMSRSYPFVYMPRLLGDLHAVPETKRYSTILLLRSGSRRVAVHVDQLIKNQEVVVKNISPQLARAPGVTGATVLGNGDIVLILNPTHLAELYADRMSSPESSNAATISVPQAEKLNTAPIVMVVDDSLTVRKITSRLLEREGYQIMLAKDGVDALQQLEDIQPDVMLLDIEMPRMDGFELTRNMRSEPLYQNIPIIMISSRTADKHRNYAFELGVNEFMGKPYQEDELLQHIQRLLAK